MNPVDLIINSLRELPLKLLSQLLSREAAVVSAYLYTKTFYK